MPTFTDAYRGRGVTVLASSARTAAPTVDVFNAVGGARSLVVTIDVTAATSSPSVVFTIQGYDSVSGKTYTLLASAAITGIGTTVLRVSPDLAVSANLIAKDIVPANWTVAAVHGNTDSITYTVGASLS